MKQELVSYILVTYLKKYLPSLAKEYFHFCLLHYIRGWKVGLVWYGH